MDANLDQELQSAIEEKINTLYGVKGVSEVKIRQSGPFRMVECKIATSPSLPLYKAHELADAAEDFAVVLLLRKTRTLMNTLMMKSMQGLRSSRL